MLDADEIHPLFHGAPGRDRVPQAAQADRAADARGDRDLRHGAAGGAVAGLPVGRQGQLYAARGADRAEVARGCCRWSLLACNLDQGQPGFPATVLPEFLEPDGGAAPDRVSRYLFGGGGQGAGGADLLRALLAAAAGASLSDRAGGGVLGGGARASPGRYRRDVLAQPLLRRQARGDAAEAAERRGRRLCSQAAGACGGGGLRAVREGMGYPIIPCDLCGSQDGLQRQQVKRDARRVGDERARGGGRSCSGR